MHRKLAHFAKFEEGVTIIEYALVASLIALAIVGTLSSLGTTVNGFFQGLLVYFR